MSECFLFCFNTLCTVTLLVGVGIVIFLTIMTFSPKGKPCKNQASRSHSLHVCGINYLSRLHHQEKSFLCTEIKTVFEFSLSLIGHWYKPHCITNVINMSLVIRSHVLRALLPYCNTCPYLQFPCDQGKTAVSAKVTQNSEGSI